MRFSLDHLAGQTLPEPSPEFQKRIEARVHPFMKRRRTIRTARFSLAACAMAACLGYLCVAGPWGFVKEPAPQGSKSACMQHMPIETLVEWSDYLVEGVVERVVVDVKRKRDRVPPKSMDAWRQVTLRLRLTQSYPPLELKHITVSTSGVPERMRAGTRLLMGIRNRSAEPDRTFYGEPQFHLIQGRGASATVPGLGTETKAMPLKEAWELIRSLHKQTHEPEEPVDSAVIESRIDALKNGPIEKAQAAFTILSTAGSAPLNEDVLLMALKRQYARLIRRCGGTHQPLRRTAEVRAYCSLAREMLKALYPVVSEDGVDRLLKFYVSDMAEFPRRVLGERDFGQEMLRFALKHPGPKRRERVFSVLGKEINYFDNKGRRVDRAILAPLSYTNLTFIAETQGEDIDKLLDDVLNGPEFTECERTPDLNDNAIQEILRIRQRKQNAGRHEGAFRMQRAFIDKQSGKQKPQARSAYVEDAGKVRSIKELLERPINDSSLDSLERDTFERIEALRHLGRIDDTVDSGIRPLLRSFLSEDVLRDYDKAQRRAHRATFELTEANRREFLYYRSLEQRPLSAELKTAALLALTRLHDPGIAERWRAIYKGDNVPQRMTAAIALYYLGDSTSEKYVEAFRNHAERSIDELYTHFRTQGQTGDFQKACMYLRSAEIDALFLERVSKGLDGGDRDALSYDLSFLRDHDERILRTLSAHLESKDRTTRYCAHSCLQSILGARTKWDLMALAGAQPEAVRELRDEVERFLSSRAASSY